MIEWNWTTVGIFAFMFVVAIGFLSAFFDMFARMMTDANHAINTIWYILDSAKVLHHEARLTMEVMIEEKKKRTQALLPGGITPTNGEKHDPERTDPPAGSERGTAGGVAAGPAGEEE